MAATTAEQKYLDSLYAELEPAAKTTYVNYFLSRTPAHLQDDMKAMVEAGLPAAPPATQSA